MATQANDRVSQVAQAQSLLEADHEKTKEALGNISTELEKIKQQSAQRQQSTASTGRGIDPLRANDPWAPQHVRLPKEQRSAFVIGSLGWDGRKDVLEERARQVLRPAGAVEGDICKLASRHQIGSLVDVEVTSNNRGRELCDKIAQLQLAVGGNPEKKVWMDVRKNFTELQPGRVLKAAAASIRRIEASKGDQARQITDCPKAKRVWISENGRNILVGWTRGGVWEWGTDASRFWTPQELDAVIQDTKN